MQQTTHTQKSNRKERRKESSNRTRTHQYLKMLIASLAVSFACNTSEPPMQLTQDKIAQMQKQLDGIAGALSKNMERREEIYGQLRDLSRESYDIALKQIKTREEIRRLERQ